MERDFMGINGKDSGSLAREEDRESRQDSAFGGGPAMQWPFSNKISALQQFMAFKAGQEERAKKLVFDQLSSSVFRPISTIDAFETNYKASAAQVQQKCFNLDRHGVHQFPMHGFQSQSTSPSGVQPNNHFDEAKSLPMVMHHSIPVAMGSPFFKVHGPTNGSNLRITTVKQPLEGGIASNAPVAGSIVGAITPRNVTKLPPTTAQLTIFYGGSVNVYDDVPLDKAQAIIIMASKGSTTSSIALNPRSEAHAPTLTKVQGVDGLTMNKPQIHIQTQIQTQAQTQTQTHTQTQTQNHAASPCSGIPSSLSILSHTGSYYRSGCSTTDDLVEAKSGGPSPNSHNEPSKTTTPTLSSAAPVPVSVMPRAIPQARKASLARFLEKRKERVTNAAPYASAKTPENAFGYDGPPSKSSSTDIALSGNRDELWSMGGQHKSSTDCENSPSTKLEM